MKYLYHLLIGLTFPFTIQSQTENSASMQEWQYTYEVHYVTLEDSIKLAYVDEGESEEVLIMIHGLGSNLQAWQKNIDGLKGQYRCIAIDLPGYGKSSKGMHAYDMAFFAETVYQFIQQLKLDKVSLIGHSMGGQIAIHTLLAHPQAATELLLLAPAGFETFTDKEGAFLTSVVTPEIIRATTEEQINNNFHLNFYEFPEDAQFMIDDRKKMRATEEYDHFCHMIPRCVKGMLEQPVFSRLSELQLPVLVIYGENDALIPNKYLHPSLSTREVAQSGVEQLPKGSLIMVAEAGHFVQWEKAATVNEAIGGFLEK
jgi:pimeloyl-ACP methyl ester carboxylesterase